MIEHKSTLENQEYFQVLCPHLFQSWRRTSGHEANFTLNFYSSLCSICRHQSSLISKISHFSLAWMSNDAQRFIPVNIYDASRELKLQTLHYFSMWFRRNHKNGINWWEGWRKTMSSYSKLKKKETYVGTDLYYWVTETQNSWNF